MPELPEVETVRRALEKAIVGKKIEDIYILEPRLITDITCFKQQNRGATIQEIKRRGKYLLIALNKWTIVSHLRMTGKYFITETNELYSKHVHVVWSFTDGSVLQYEDVRKFGRFDMVSNDDLEDYFKRKKLGVEPTVEDFSVNEFKKALQHKRQMIKIALLNQQIVAGLGNIYVDEVLYQSHIHPMRLASQLQHREINSLHAHIIETLQQAIEAGGTTVKDYSSLGEQGTFQTQLRVYGQTDKPCLFCGTPIERIVVGQRGTHICPHCQKLKR